MAWVKEVDFGPYKSKLSLHHLRELEVDLATEGERGEKVRHRNRFGGKRGVNNLILGNKESA